MSLKCCNLRNFKAKRNCSEPSHGTDDQDWHFTHPYLRIIRSGQSLNSQQTRQNKTWKLIGWFSTVVIGAFQSSLFRWVVLSVVRFFAAYLLLCFLIVGTNASGISIPLSLLMLWGWSLMWIASLTLRVHHVRILSDYIVRQTIYNTLLLKNCYSKFTLEYGFSGTYKRTKSYH